MTTIALPLYINTYNGKYRSGADGAPTPLNIVYVSTTGSDSNNGTSLATAYLTINKAISVATAGTAIKIKAGTYKESTVFTLSGSFFSLAATVDGTPANPIVLQAYEGDEGLVNLDGEGVRLGLLANYRDYWIVRGIRFINCFSHGIFNYDLGSWKTAPNQDPPYSSFSVGWIVENCLIKGVISNTGENSSCISPWSTKDWVIRNNRLVGYSSTDGNANSNGVNGIQSYGGINLKVYHNDFVGVNYGLFLKDHYVRNSVTRGWYDETEVYLNKINAVGVAFCVGIRGTSSCESGNHYVHNNVMFGATGLFSDAYIKSDLGGAYLQSGRIRLENNVIDVGATNRTGVFANSFIEYINKGNVFVGTNQELQFRTSGDVNHQGRLTYSDYNAYTTSFAARMNIFSVDGSDTTFSSLSSWNSAVAGTPTSLSVTNPDLHSLESTGTTIFQNYGTNDYRPAVGSSILSRMADGSNIGAYQIGTETMGILPTYTAGV